MAENISTLMKDMNINIQETRHSKKDEVKRDSHQNTL